MSTIHRLFLNFQIRESDELSQSRTSSTGAEPTSLSLQQLQTLVAEEYGETHFGAAQEPLLYFQVYHSHRNNNKNFNNGTVL